MRRFGGFRRFVCVQKRQLLSVWPQAHVSGGRENLSRRTRPDRPDGVNLGLGANPTFGDSGQRRRAVAWPLGMEALGAPWGRKR